MAERVTEARRREWWERHKMQSVGVFVFRVADAAKILALCEASDAFWRAVRRAVCEQLNERGVRCLCCQHELPGDPVAVVILAADSSDELISAGVCRECCARLEDRQIVDRMAAPFNGVVLGRADEIAANVHAAHGTKQ